MSERKTKLDQSIQASEKAGSWMARMQQRCRRTWHREETFCSMQQSGGKGILTGGGAKAEVPIAVWWWWPIAMQCCGGGTSCSVVSCPLQTQCLINCDSTTSAPPVQRTRRAQKHMFWCMHIVHCTVHHNASQCMYSCAYLQIQRGNAREGNQPRLYFTHV